MCLMVNRSLGLLKAVIALESRGLFDHVLTLKSCLYDPSLTKT